MKLTPESKAFHFGVYSVVLQIPFGKVTSYKPDNSRQVGSSLKHCRYIINELNVGLSPDDRDYLNIDELPWWRVISSSGKISPRDTNGQYVQADKLREESVVVSNGHLVDMQEYGWFPEQIEY
ncbi:hypothetical protein G210_0044 [Candida maltosa Xu316]|uniref:6-O-methylguanine-DNA methyltransferase n=1 Tax=Candida maltosa (strain Xu316) TaxID=1245528 RepID=M3K1U8_CANMX|nr:hypothetical protein G210_0044 [Candida maltosa Xu316]